MNYGCSYVEQLMSSEEDDDMSMQHKDSARGLLGLSAAKLIASRYLVRRQCRHLRECFYSWEGYINKTLQLQVCYRRKKRIWAKRTMCSVWSGWIWAVDARIRTRHAEHRVCKRRRASVMTEFFQLWNECRGPSLKPRHAFLSIHIVSP